MSYKCLECKREFERPVHVTIDNHNSSGCAHCGSVEFNKIDDHHPHEAGMEVDTPKEVKNSMPTKQKRYIVTSTYEMFANTDEEAISRAQDIAALERSEYENHYSVQNIKTSEEEKIIFLKA